MKQRFSLLSMGLINEYTKHLLCVYLEVREIKHSRYSYSLHNPSTKTDPETKTNGAVKSQRKKQ